MRDLDQPPIKYLIPAEISYITDCIWNITANNGHRQPEHHTEDQIRHHLRWPRRMILADLLENNPKTLSSFVWIIQDALEKSFDGYAQFNDYVNQNFAGYLKGRQTGVPQRKMGTKLIPLILNKAALTLSVNGGKPHKITVRQCSLFETLGHAKPSDFIALSAFGFPAARIKCTLKPASLKKLIEVSPQGEGYRLFSKYKIIFR